MPECAYCHAEEALKKCSACKSAWYCSRECQVAHFKVHKRECKKYKQASAGIMVNDEDMVKMKQDFEWICEKYNFRNEEMSSKLADFLTDPRHGSMETTALAENFGMSMEDANKFMLWIQLGTRFKRDVIDRNAERFAQGAM